MLMGAGSGGEGFFIFYVILIFVYIILMYIIEE